MTLAGTKWDSRYTVTANFSCRQSSDGHSFPSSLRVYIDGNETGGTTLYDNKTATFYLEGSRSLKIKDTSPGETAATYFHEGCRLNVSVDSTPTSLQIDRWKDNSRHLKDFFELAEIYFSVKVIIMTWFDKYISNPSGEAGTLTQLYNEWKDSPIRYLKVQAQLLKNILDGMNRADLETKFEEIKSKARLKVGEADQLIQTMEEAKQSVDQALKDMNNRIKEKV
jgi:hypothetical protein